MKHDTGSRTFSTIQYSKDAPPIRVTIRSGQLVDGKRTIAYDKAVTNIIMYYFCVINEINVYRVENM